MLLTKYGHSCVRLDKDDARLIIDPGVWSGPDVLAGANVVLVTHEHPDHLDADEVRTALSANAELELYANENVARQYAEFGSRVKAVRHGDTFTAAGFVVHVYGSEHALIDRAVPVIPNTGFAIDGELFHPGDSFTVPEDKVPTLMLPITAPWLKFAEVGDYLRTVEPQRAFWIHDALLNDKGAQLLTNLVKAVPTATGPASFLVPGTSIEL